MALLFYDGFDHYGTVMANVGKKWDGGGPQGVTTTNARNGSCIQLASSNNLMKLMPVPGTTFILGAALRLPSASPASYLIRFQEGSTVHIDINVNASGFLTVKMGATLIATATNNPLSALSYYYVEVKVVIHDTAGSVACRIDGVPVTFNATLTGIDTRNAGTGIVDRFQLDGQTTSPFVLVDDLYLCDASGSINNDFLGICAVESFLPQTGNGDLTGLTPSTGTDHGALVDENPANDDTDYNTGDTAGQTDCYNYPSLALTGSILGVQTDLFTRKTDAGARTVAPVMRIGGTTYPGTAVPPLTTYRYLPQVWELNPATGLAWTTADIAALQAGMKIVT